MNSVESSIFDTKHRCEIYMWKTQEGKSTMNLTLSNFKL